MARRTLLPLFLLVAFASPSRAYEFALEKKNTAFLGTGCYDVKTADLNGDGLADAVAANNDTHRIAVMLTTAAGLGTPTFYAGGQAVAVDLADFDANGSIDILEADYNENQVRLLVNAGNGTFTIAASYAVPGPARDVASTDWNGDGKRDAVVVTGNGYVTFLLGQNGGFQAPFSQIFGLALKGVAAGDLDNDGDPDLAVVDAVGDKLILLRNDGGAFPASLLSSRATSGHPSDVALADFDGDSFLDIAFSQENNVLGVVPGGFADSAQVIHTYPIGTLSQSVQVANFDGEGGPDILVSAWGQSLVQVLRNHGNFVFDRVVSAATSTNPRSAAPGDFDADGRMDVASGDAGGGVATLLLNHPAFPHLSYSPPAIDFGTGYQGYPTDREILLQNTGTGTLTVTPGVIDGDQFAYAGPNPPVDIPGGGAAYLVIRCMRLSIGDATGAVHFTTNDPAAPSVTVDLSATTTPAYPNASVDPAALHFGTDFTGTQEVLSLEIVNDGLAVLHVTPGAIDGSEFSYAGSSAPFTVDRGSSQTLSIRYARSVDGAASGTLHLGTDDPDTPEILVALDGFAGPPPVADFSAPSPITVSAGSTGQVSVIVRNIGTSPLLIDVPDVALDLAEVSALDLGPTSQEFLRFDVSGAMWNLDWEGKIQTGMNGEYAGGMDESNFLVQTGGVLGLGGRELRLGPVAVAPGILVTRKIYVPGSGNWVRYIDVAENPNETSRTATFDLIDNIGYVPNAPILTSDGDAQFELSDDWIIAPASADRRTVGRVFRSVGAANVPVLATWFASPGVPGSYARTRYVTTLAPHDRACVIQWAVQASNTSAASALLEAFRQDPSPGLQFTDAIDRATPWNLAQAPKPFRPVAGQYLIAPGDSVAIPVIYGAEAATHDADLSAILRITTDDPDHRTLAVPLEFSIADGQVVGVEPPPVSKAIELAGFRPNPTRMSGAARVAFRLATNEPATLTLYDVRGRALIRHVLPAPAPGPGTVQLSGADLKPGVVCMRLEQGGKVVTRKGIVLP